jgi:hypothetical protein
MKTGRSSPWRRIYHSLIRPIRAPSAERARNGTALPGQWTRINLRDLQAPEAARIAAKVVQQRNDQRAARILGPRVRT